MRLSFVIPGPPVPCQRARVVRGGGRVHGVTPQRTRDYEELVAHFAKVAVMRLPGWRADAPAFGVTLRIYRAARRGDWDNFAKGICDGMRRIVYGDDAAILDGHVQLFIDRANPRAEVEVELLENR